ncbi:hypothetical protein [uncultured Psychroserpens sp.]|uniref:hypothetical protein n=1 Tax=uncultured Psychroserpens sp. TaxID=255436 RepID=UPI00260D22A8|nr:hypothetical protein [uncultured Psychroserpens sp.]
MNTQTQVTILDWWESKRLWFNILVGISGILGILSGIFEFLLADLLGVFAWGILANILFSTGIVVELLDDFYLKGKLKLYHFRWAFLVSGTLLYCAWTFLYAIWYFSPFLGF